MRDRRESLRSLLRARGIADRIVEPLCDYTELLTRWNRTHNLISYRGEQELVERHLAEALAGADRIGESGRLVDIGSGAGLPGVPILIAKPGWRGTLVEPRLKRWAFLKLIIRELGLQADAVRGRYQDLGSASGSLSSGGPDAITVRALAVDEELLEWAAKHLAENGRVLIWTGKGNLDWMRDRTGWHVLSSPLAGRSSAVLAVLNRER